MRLTVALSLFLFSCFALIAAPPKLKRAPEISFTIPSQGQRRLSDYLGKIVAIEFIYTTCAPCVNTTCTMQKLQSEFGGQGFQAIAVAFNPNAAVLVEDFVNSNHFTLPVGWTIGSDVASFLGYGPADRFVTPQFVLIDATGLIRYQTPAQGDDGHRNGSMLRDQILHVLHPTPASPKEAVPANR
jgi:peroxiredoxin